MTFFALIGFEEVVKAVSESRSSADRWIRSIFCIPYKMLKSQKYEYGNYNRYHLGFDGLLGLLDKQSGKRPEPSNPNGPKKATFLLRSLVIAFMVVI